MSNKNITIARTTVAAVTAAAVNLIIFAIGSASGATWDAGSPYQINFIMVALFSIVPLALAAIVVALIARRAPKFQQIAAWLGLAFAIVTIAGSLTMSSQLLTGLLLGAMHIAVGAAWFFISYRKPAVAETAIA